MCVRASRGYERLQGAASALGKRIDADGQENLAEGIPGRRAVSREIRGIFSSDGQHFVSANGAALHDAPAGDDRALLSRLVSDAGDRPAPFPGFDVLHLKLLSGCAEGIAAEDLDEHV